MTGLNGDQINFRHCNSYSTKFEELVNHGSVGYDKKGTFILSSACDYEYEKGKSGDSETKNQIHVIRNGFCLNQYKNTSLDKLCARSGTQGGIYFARGIFRKTMFTLTYEIIRYNG